MSRRRRAGFYHWRVLCAAAALAAGLSAGAGRADHNYQGHLLGDRASGMGMTGVANPYASDAAFYNPAGLGKAENDSLSFMANFYGFRHYKSDSAFSTGEDLDLRSLEIIPATAGSVMRISSNTAAAFSLYLGLGTEGPPSEGEPGAEKKGQGNC